MLYPLSYGGGALRKTWPNALCEHSLRYQQGSGTATEVVAAPDRVADRGWVVGLGLMPQPGS